jgi:hypothetical protein
MHAEFWWGNLGKRQHVEGTCRRENNAKINLQETGFADLAWNRDR